jgi:hypothetical protein
MKRLSAQLIEIVRTALKGKRLEKFDQSVAVINESLERGAWVKRGSVKANSGFYQGLVYTGYQQNVGSREGREAWELSHCLAFGGEFRGKNPKAALTRLREGYDRKGEPIRLKLTDEQVLAWVELCAEKARAVELLDAARPLPVITKIGLSPKVTKTLKEMDLDIDIQTVRMARLKRHERMVAGAKAIWYTVEWTKGIVHGTSRFAGRGACEACGKPIPSCRFVPVEARDTRGNRLVSLWLGCDCAANIFGIKDVGVEQIVLNARKESK